MSDTTWVDGFLESHRGRFVPHDWPAADSDEYLDLLGDWIEAFRAAGVTEGEAVRASRRLTLAPPRWRRDHLPAVMETIRAMRAERAPAEAPETRDAAAAQSRDCARCGGQGLAPVTGTAERHGAFVEYSCAAHCVCPLGRWMRKTIAAARGGEVLVRRIPDLDRLPYGFRETHPPEVAGTLRPRAHAATAAATSDTF